MKLSVKKTFLTITIFIIILFSIQAFSLNSSAFFVEENGIIFSNYNDRIGISGVSDESITDLIIPETVDENNKNYCSVNGVIYSKDLTQLCFYPVGNSNEVFTVPEGIIKIEDKAFKNSTKLKEINFSESLAEIGAEAFYGCSFKTIKFPENVTETSGAFCKCSALESVTFLREKPLPNNFLDYFYSGDFEGCEQKIIFYVPDTVVQNYKFLIELYDIVLNYDVQPLSMNPYNIKGDVNFDGIVSLADVIMLQNALLNSGNIKSWRAGDIDENDAVNIFDLILIKRKVIGNLLM